MNSGHDDAPQFLDEEMAAATHSAPAPARGGSYNGAVVVIPTRNRADLAVRAIKSVLEQPDCDVEVLVSDNSSVESERAALESFCSTYAPGCLSYVRPTRSLAMTEHWEWALQLALKRSERDHFIFLTDRMIFLRGELGRVLSLAARFPRTLVSYHHDRIVDYQQPIRVEQHPWTGNALLIDTLRLSKLYSEALPHPCLPRMLNCVAPRSVLDAVSRRFGSVFGSISPDYNFGFRCLDVEKSIVYYDKSAIVGYALYRSNGASLERGVETTDHADFMANLGTAKSPFFAAPAPEIQTVGNAIFHEYCVVKEYAHSPRYFPINFEAYLGYLARELGAVENPRRRGALYDALEARGWCGERRLPPTGDPPRAPPLRRMRTRLKWELRSSRLRFAWQLLWRILQWPPHDSRRFEFECAEDALKFVNDYPRPRGREWKWQVDLLQAREMRGPDQD